MKTIKISEETHQAIVNYQNYLYQKQGQKWTFDELINIAICNDYSEAILMDERIERQIKEDGNK